MTQNDKKIGVGITLLVLFLVTLITGIILHLKSHGIVLQPRGVIKVIHWVSGFSMIAFMGIHWSQFRKMLSNMKTRFRWFWLDTNGVIVFSLVTFLTGAIKLLLPVKIPHLTLWHYWFGIAMAVVIAIHLVRALPALRRLSKLKNPSLK